MAILHCTGWVGRFLHLICIYLCFNFNDSELGFHTHRLCFDRQAIGALRMEEKK